MMTREENLRHLGVKYECFEHYSGGPPCCAFCGCHDLRKLQLDHINNDGKEQRMQLMAMGFGYQMCAGHPYYRYLRKLGYPDDLNLQVLCTDCHNKKGKPKKVSNTSNITITIQNDHINPIVAYPQSLWKEEDNIHAETDTFQR